MLFPFQKKDCVIEAIASMQLSDNFWGFLFSRTKKVQDDKMPAAFKLEFNRKTCRYQLSYNMKFCSRMSMRDLKQGLAHEGFHAINKHISDRYILVTLFSESYIDYKMRAKLWGFAADFATNTALDLTRSFPLKTPVEEKLANGKVFKMESYDLLFPDQFDLPSCQSTEWYYTNILQRLKDRQEKQNLAKQLGGKNQPKISPSDYNNMPQMNEEELDALLSSMLQNALRNHDGSDLDKLTESGVDFIEELRRAEEEMKRLVTDSVRNMRDRGNMPGFLQQLIDEWLRNPKLPYYEIIAKYVAHARKELRKKSPFKIARKRAWMLANKSISIIPFPGWEKDVKFNVVVLIDTSGSMSNEQLAEALSGVANIIERDPNSVVTVLEVDTQINKEYEIKKIRDIDPNMSGRGGTTLTPGLLRARELQGDVTLAFTDGYCEEIKIPKDKLPKNLLWIIPEETGSTHAVEGTNVPIIRIPKL